MKMLAQTVDMILLILVNSKRQWSCKLSLYIVVLYVVSDFKCRKFEQAYYIHSGHVTANLPCQIRLATVQNCAKRLVILARLISSRIVPSLEYDTESNTSIPVFRWPGWYCSVSAGLSTGEIDFD
jgi:hypothetical protein